MKKLYLLCFALPILAGCQMAKVCDNDISNTIAFANFKPAKNDTASLAILNRSGKIKEEFTFKSIHYWKENNTTDVDFNNPRLNGKNIYKLTYNNDVFFIYDFKVSSEKKVPRACEVEEPTFKLNDCPARVSLLRADKSCGIPASDADAYFKKYVQPTIKRSFF